MNQSAEPFCRNDRQDLFFKNEEVPGSIFNMIMFRDPFLNNEQVPCLVFQKWTGAMTCFFRTEHWTVTTGLALQEWNWQVSGHTWSELTNARSHFFRNLVIRVKCSGLSATPPLGPQPRVGLSSRALQGVRATRNWAHSYKPCRPTLLSVHCTLYIQCM